MMHYRCYFLGSSLPVLGVPRSFSGATGFDAGTDEEARRKAELMYRWRASRNYGFELWRGDRLVCRHEAPHHAPEIVRLCRDKI